jgi:hypothetical protein
VRGTIYSGIIYKGHVLRVQTEGQGFAVHVRPCASPFALDDPMPYDLDKDVAMTIAERLVDSTIAKRVLSRP